MKSRIAAVALLSLTLSFSSAFGMKETFKEDGSSEKMRKEEVFKPNYQTLQDDGNPLHLDPNKDENSSK